MKNSEIDIKYNREKEMKILTFKNEKILIQNYIIKVKIIIIFFLLLNKFSSRRSYLNKYSNEKIFLLNNQEKLSKLKGINYLNKCLEKLKKNKEFSFFNFFNYKLNIFKKKPKISVIIPVYNCQNSIEITITSIQNQNTDDFEIILINDYSNDNSSLIINKLKNVDDRIKIINNQKNMGTLYSRCIGVLNAKGKYIFSLDNDDIFLDEDILKTIYNIAEKDYYDIVEFKTFTIPNYHPKINEIRDNYFNHHSNNLILRQPELGLFPISKNNKYYSNDFLIWGKSIKTKTYKMAINALGEKRYSIYNSWTEDISILIVIFNLANSYIFINKYGIFHLKANTTFSYVLKKEHKIFAQIYLLNILLEFLKNNEKSKKYAILKAYALWNKIKKKSLSKKNTLFLKSVLKKILLCKYIIKSDKKQIKNILEKLKNI